VAINLDTFTIFDKC